jgi:hypothetical protein
LVPEHGRLEAGGWRLEAAGRSVSAEGAEKSVSERNLLSGIGAGEGGVGHGEVGWVGVCLPPDILALLNRIFCISVRLWHLCTIQATTRRGHSFGIRCCMPIR